MSTRVSSSNSLSSSIEALHCKPPATPISRPCSRLPPESGNRFRRHCSLPPKSCPRSASNSSFSVEAAKNGRRTSSKNLVPPSPSLSKTVKLLTDGRSHQTPSLMRLKDKENITPHSPERRYPNRRKFLSCGNNDKDRSSAADGRITPISRTVRLGERDRTIINIHCSPIDTRANESLGTVGSPLRPARPLLVIPRTTPHKASICIVTPNCDLFELSAEKDVAIRKLKSQVREFESLTSKLNAEEEIARHNLEHARVLNVALKDTAQENVNVRSRLLSIMKRNPETAKVLSQSAQLMRTSQRVLAPVLRDLEGIRKDVSEFVVQ